MRPLLACTLLTLLLATAPAYPQSTADNAEALAELEQLAEDSFADDDLEAAVVLYRQLAGQTTVRQERSRVLMTVAYLEHLMQRETAAVATVTATLVEDPNYAFQADLYNESMRDVFYRGQKAAVEKRSSLAQQNIRQGNNHLRERDYGAARQQFEAALAYQPGHPTALYNLALTHLYDRQEEQAEAGFQKLLALGTPVGAELRALAMTNLGYLYERRRLYQEAEDILKQAVELDPSSARAWSILGVARRQMGQTIDAAAAFRRAYELSPSDTEAMSHLALAYIDTKDWQQAVTLLEKATATEATRANLWLNLGVARLGVGRADDAVNAFETAIRHDPSDAGGWASSAAVQMAEHFYETHQYENALRQADRALGWRSDLVTARIFQGLARESLGDLQGARESLEEARRLDPTRADTHNNLGSVYYQLGLLSEATSSPRTGALDSARFPSRTAEPTGRQRGRKAAPTIDFGSGRHPGYPLADAHAWASSSPTSTMPP